MAVVLCTGVDATLLRTRKMMLEHAGHTVTTVSAEDQLRDACETTKFDVAVVGQGVSPRQKRRVFELVRSCCPNAKVLELYAPYTAKVLEDADDWLLVPADVPHELIDKVAQLAPAKEPRKSRKRS